jgi:hypothetical protein
MLALIQALKERHLANKSAGTSGRSGSSLDGEHLESSGLRSGKGKRLRSFVDGAQGSRKNKRVPGQHDTWLVDHEEGSDRAINSGREEDDEPGHEEASSDSCGSSDNHSSSEEGGGSSSEEDPVLDSEQLTLLSTLSSPGLNSSLLSMYEKGSHAIHSSHSVKTEGAIVPEMGGRGGGGGGLERPAFAPLSEVAAAAARALAANRESCNPSVKQAASGSVLKVAATPSKQQQQEMWKPLGKISLELQDNSAITSSPTLVGNAAAKATMSIPVAGAEPAAHQQGDGAPATAGVALESNNRQQGVIK